MTFNTAQTLQAEKLETRAMSSSDLEAVLLIERNAHVSPWSRLSFEESLTKNYLCRVIRHNGDVVAYSVLCEVVDELHVLNVAVAPQYQGAGLGHTLVDDFITQAKALTLKQVFLEVRASNYAAQSLYLKWGFEQIAIRKRYYSMPSSTNKSDREDALIYQKKLEQASFAQPVSFN